MIRKSFTGKPSGRISPRSVKYLTASQVLWSVMANPLKPLARAASMSCSGLLTPSPEKNEWQCRSIFRGMRRLTKLESKTVLQLRMAQAEATLGDQETKKTHQGISFAFKEWALVCASMLLGATSLIFRKGRVAEGRDGFRFQHDRFFLFPTFFHEQTDRLRIDIPIPEPNADVVAFSAYIQVEFTRWIENLSLLEPLSDLHRLKPEVLEQRFAYDDPKGLPLAMILVFRVTPQCGLPLQKRFGACPSWVEQPSPRGELLFTLLIGDAEPAARVSQ